LNDTAVQGHEPSGAVFLSYASQDAAAAERMAGGVTPVSWTWRGIAYATCGDTPRAQQTLKALQDLEARQYVDPFVVADLLTALGQMDKAIRDYEKAYEDRSPNLAWAKTSRRINPSLAGNARFEAIVTRIHVPAPLAP